MSADGFVVLQLTPTQRLVGSSNVFDTVADAQARVDALTAVAPVWDLAHFHIARIEYIQDAS